MNFKLVATVLTLCLLLLAVPALADSDNTHPPISTTTFYSGGSSYDSPFTGIAFTTETAGPGVDRAVNGSCYYVAGSDKFLVPKLWVHDGDNLNFTFTTRGGRTISGYIIKSSTSPVSSWVTFSMDGVTKSFAGSRWILPFVEQGNQFFFDYSVYNVNEQYAISVDNLNGQGIIVTPLLNINDSISSFYIKSNTGNAWLKISEYWISTRYININGQTAVPDANGTYVSTITGKSALQQSIDDVFKMWDTFKSVFETLFVAIMFLYYFVQFIFSPVVLALIFLLLETGYAALVTNTSKDIWAATGKFMKFNRALFMAIFETAQIIMGFVAIMFNALLQLPAIIAKGVEMAVDVGKFLAQLGSAVVTILLLAPK